MKDRLKYVIDSRYFDGTCLTSMSDGFHNDYGGETIEELRIRENNPYLKAVTPSDIDKKLRLYNQSLSEPFKEITEEDYYDLLDVLPPLRMRQNSFFVGEPYYGNMYSFCFTRQGRYFKGLRSVLTPQSELDSQIDRHMEIINRKAVISKEETSKTISGTRLIPYYFSLDGKQSVFICNLVIQSDSRQARTDMANTLKSLRRNHYQFYKGKGHYETMYQERSSPLFPTDISFNILPAGNPQLSSDTSRRHQRNFFSGSMTVNISCISLKD